MHNINILLIITSFTLNSYFAFVQKPIIDLLGDKKETFSDDIYATMPYSWERSIKVCPRIFQLLLHDIVDILEEHDQEIKVAVPNVYYLKNGILCNEFWTLKENCLPIDDQIPTIHNAPIVKTLVVPYHDITRNIEFSAGTKFMVLQNSNELVSVLFYNIQSRSFESMTLNKAFFFEQSNDQIQDFINVIRAWIETDEGFIPYVWGGASACYRLQEKFHLKTGPIGDDWSYDHDEREVKSGFDCSGMIVRAAHIAGLPFTYRNTLTIATYLDPLQKTEAIEAGDIIFFKGHVIVIADLEKNTCIEARAYGSGYGKIHEIHVAKLFNNIPDFYALKNAYHQNASLELLDIHDNKRQVTDFKILKLRTIFKKAKD